MNEDKIIEYITKAPGIDAFSKLPWTEYTAGELANDIISESLQKNQNSKPNHSKPCSKKEKKLWVKR